GGEVVGTAAAVGAAPEADHVFGIVAAGERKAVAADHDGAGAAAAPTAAQGVAAEVVHRVVDVGGQGVNVGGAGLHVAALHGDVEAVAPRGVELRVRGDGGGHPVVGGRGVARGDAQEGDVAAVDRVGEAVSVIAEGGVVRIPQNDGRVVAELKARAGGADVGDAALDIHLPKRDDGEHALLRGLGSVGDAVHLRTRRECERGTRADGPGRDGQLVIGTQQLPIRPLEVVVVRIELPDGTSGRVGP